MATPSRNQLLTLIFSAFFFIASGKELKAQFKNGETSLENAKGLFLTSILDINTIDRQPMGFQEVCFTIEDKQLIIADLVLRKWVVDTLILYRVDLPTSKVVCSATLDLTSHNITGLRHIKAVNDSTYFMASETGILKILWTGEKAKLLKWNSFDDDLLKPTRLKVINDSILLLGSMKGGDYQDYAIGKTYPAGYSMYNFNTNQLDTIIPVKIPGIRFTGINNHRFLALVDSQVVYSSGYNYSIKVESAYNNTITDSFRREINDPYWVEVHDTLINYLNTLHKYYDRQQIQRVYDSLSFRISNINSVIPVENTSDRFVVLLEYGSGQYVKHRAFEKITIDYFSAKDGKLQILNNNISHPNNMLLFDTVDNRHHKLHIFDESCFSEQYAVFYQRMPDDTELKNILLAEKGSVTLNTYYTLHKNISDKKGIRHFFYIYKYY